MYNLENFKVENIAELYNVVGKHLLNYGDKVSPRGKETREILTPVIQIDNPRGRLAYKEGRKFNLIYALVESLMLFNKEDKLSYFSKFNKNMEMFSDDGVHLFGAYGNRFANFITNAIEKLKEDKDTRQAVLTVYNNDCGVKTKDVPCTLSLGFIIRDNKLNMIVHMRSNDIIWGLPYDLFMFTMLQEVVANSVGVEMGWYRHIPTSLHVYKEHYELLEEMISAESVEFANPFEYEGYNYVAKNYMALVDSNSKSSTSAGPNFSLETADNVYQYLNIIKNEMSYRDKNKGSHDGNKFTPLIVPEWTKTFTKRWYE